LNIDGNSNLHGLGRQALLVVAGLVAEFAVHHYWAGRQGRRRLEVRDDLEIPAENRERRHGEVVLFDLRFWIDNLLGLQRILGPGELQWDEIVVGGLVAIDVEAGLQLQLEFYIRRSTALDADVIGGSYCENVIGLGA